MDLVLNGYALQHICKFLDPIDIINMCHVYPYQWKKLYYVFKASVINKIDNFFRDYFGPHYDTFREEMIQNKAVISGSFILQAILGEKWENSDIDIYIPIKGLTLKTTGPGNPKTPLEDFFYFTTIHNCPNFQSGYATGPGTEIKYIRDYTKMDSEVAKQFVNQQLLKKDDNMDITTTDYLHKRHMLDIKEKKPKDKIRLQTILVDIEPNFTAMKEYIYTNYDLDICRNIFYYGNGNGNSQLNIMKAFQIIDKKTNFNFKPIVSVPLCRYKKYTDRGFTFMEDKMTIFNMVIDKALCYSGNSTSNQFIKKYKVFETKWISDDVYNKYQKLSTYEIVKNLSNDTFPLFIHEKRCNAYSDGSIIKFYQSCKHDMCPDAEACPIRLCLGDNIGHFHIYRFCDCHQNDYAVEFIFIDLKN